MVANAVNIINPKIILFLTLGGFKVGSFTTIDNPPITFNVNAKAATKVGNGIFFKDTALAYPSKFIIPRTPETINRLAINNSDNRNICNMDWMVVLVLILLEKLITHFIDNQLFEYIFSFAVQSQHKHTCPHVGKKT